MKRLTTTIITLITFISINCFAANDDGPLSDTAYKSLLQQGILVKEASVFVKNFKDSFVLNFEISESDAKSLLPAGLSPLRVKIVESENSPNYYLSWNATVLDFNQIVPVSRIDLYTYAKDQNNESALYLVSSYVSISAGNDLQKFGIFKEIFDFLARDTTTGLPAYPLQYIDTLSVGKNNFELSLEDSAISLASCNSLNSNELFTLDFINAHSQIYRNNVDKDVNYFSQDFVNARVTSLNPNCVSYSNLEGIHPMLSSLKSVQYFGSSSQNITWYYEVCKGNNCTSPLM